MEIYSFSDRTETGLVVAAGGFEDRARSFLKKTARARFSAERGVLLRYESQRLDNEPNFLANWDRMMSLVSAGSEGMECVPVSSDTPIQSCGLIRACIEQVAETLSNRAAIIDISGMTHLWALSAIHDCVSCGLRTEVVYTEAKSYRPLRSEWRTMQHALRSGKDQVVFQALQSASLKAVHILPEFGGNFRPGRQTCLIIFAGYEPNRLQGLVDDYSPGRLIVLFGRSPNRSLGWRTELARNLHQELFRTWYKREAEVSTLDVASILETLENEFAVIGEQFDVSIAPHCSKMQGVAAYLFWRRHPEVQLVFTSPVMFHRDHYSHGSGMTYTYLISNA
jgi:hypothetical protein